MTPLGGSQGTLSSRQGAWAYLVPLALALAVGATSFYNFLLFHTLVEIASVIAGVTIFVIALNTRFISDNAYLMFLGTAYAFVGFLDLVHTLSYKGMGILPAHDANLPTQLWIAARYLQSLALLIAPLYLTRKLVLSHAILIFVGLTALVLLTLFVWPVFPDCFIEGTGLTPFKRISEYIISSILVVSVYLHYRGREHLDRTIFQLMIASILLTIISELAFTFYVSVYGLSNLVGHVFKLLAVALVYRATVVVTLQRPYSLLFGDLARSEQRNQQTIAQLQDALRQVKQLQGFLPICASCKKIRDDRGYWNQIEAYISDHSEAVFSHGICPDCAKKLYPEFDLDEPE